MEFEGSCPQDAVGLVVLKGLSLSASTGENQSSFQVFELTDTVHALIGKGALSVRNTAILMNQGMEFEGSCPQDAVGLVVLKGLSLSASTGENQSSFVLSLTSKSSELGCER
ncbi:hypothetical protein NC651_027880 [Populus alba x Populus x berolinensis]|nr:hypothetical protein NC651_027879 [Populus alba x Populus x berolinensis]KAJ6881160.1 hypothetical protein NC651_027880 [Populus alba x Populus x berolinensis]